MIDENYENKLNSLRQEASSSKQNPEDVDEPLDEDEDDDSEFEDDIEYDFEGDEEDEDEDEESDNPLEEVDYNGDPEAEYRAIPHMMESEIDFRESIWPGFYDEPHVDL